jgi:SAM-dependent methyltransferase
MRKMPVFAVAALAALAAAVAPPAAAQELTWPQFRGYDVPYVPTPPEVVDEMLRLAGVRSGDILYDLGCGDGRIVIAAAKRYGVKAVGIDIDPVRVAESNDNAAAAGLAGKVRFVQKDIFEADFRDATVVTMYLLNSVNVRLRPKLLAELKPGTRLVSHSFEMGEWRPDKTVEVSTSFDDRRDVHFWVIPANVTGRWDWDVPAGRQKRHVTLRATQEFQIVEATGTEDGQPLAVGGVVVSGDRISFRVDTAADGKDVSLLYEGKVLGDAIEGTVRPAGDVKAAAVVWKAVRDPKTVTAIAK